MKTYLDYQEAAEKYDLEQGLLEQLVQERQIRIGRYKETLLLLEDDVANEAAKRIDKREFAYLEKETIGAGEAARKYNLSMTSLLLDKIVDLWYNS